MISVFAVDKVQLINTVINRVFHNCVGRIKLYVMDRVNMYFWGTVLAPHVKAAFSTWASSFPLMGRIAFQRLPDTGIYIHVYVYRIKTTVNRGEFSSYYTL